MIKTEIYLGSHPELLDYEEDAINSFIENSVRGLLSNATITKGIGIYQGNKEYTTIVTVVHEENWDIQLKENINTFCEMYKQCFNQESILLVNSNVYCTYV